MRALKLCLPVILLLLPLPVRTQQPAEGQPSGVQRKTYFFKEAGVNQEYLLYVPPSYRKSSPTPLIVALHGAGSNPDEVMEVAGLTRLAGQRGYIVAAPMGLHEFGGYGARPGRSPNRPQDPENAGELSERDVLNVLEVVRNQFTIDPRRIFLMGHSMGASGTIYLGTKYPELWTALGAVAPGLRSAETDLAPIRNTPVILIHGQLDQTNSVRASRMLARQMKDLGMTYEYDELPGFDHIRIFFRAPENITRIFDFFDKALRH